MAERQPVVIDTDVAYLEQGVMLEFLKNRNLVLAQENKQLSQEVKALNERVAKLESESVSEAEQAEG